ncbi:2,4-dienoyl-CoA reductase-like NADH-dependent reductase (Old Yellow Enzyme family) [Saccharothrix tamanrassetensis]|uniref:2,4-dienoyl-CoA reductase-like NADH-dependent reductase (Old Yellow Enzyme family) n=1 Tax=Saccharothrix tamanrassetensis TaxID=1051531 RepID=A0A841CEK4_9PSEU|nr:NADH:flavin oxidoreductase/NADH oxidase [Saccharothrix tamanrassetensis]MBB5954598.1 2,4-dienoyl-CoA reductase-like NADH-dependent reductase (Old Yellow Enzyme family) [Saccharothrix tamanrassetensis]
MSALFSPLTLRSVTLPNRIAVSPMCQYSARDGFPDEWHLVHLGSRAVGGAGLVLSEATAVQAVGRISPADTGLWDDAHIEAWRPITAFIRAHGAVPGVQLAHAGRKASTHPPFAPEHGGVSDEEGGWTPVAPSAVPFSETYRVPTELDEAGIAQVVADFAAAARRAVAAGFDVVEVHAAHGYLLHEFLSPLSNQRTDGYGGSLANRTRIAREVTAAVREAVGEDVPVLVRISATDWVDGGWTAEDSVALARDLTAVGADLIDVSTGGNVPKADIPVGPGYQVPFAKTVRQKADVPVGAVGMITEARQAEEILADGSADLVLLARELLRDPYWPWHAAKELGARVTPPKQYARAF